MARQQLTRDMRSNRRSSSHHGDCMLEICYAVRPFLRLISLVVDARWCGESLVAGHLCIVDERFLDRLVCKVGVECVDAKGHQDDVDDRERYEKPEEVGMIARIRHMKHDGEEENDIGPKGHPESGKPEPKVGERALLSLRKGRVEPILACWYVEGGAWARGQHVTQHDKQQLPENHCQQVDRYQNRLRLIRIGFPCMVKKRSVRWYGHTAIKSK